jgi:glucose dehydrogenase
MATLLMASSLVVSIPTLRPASAQQVQAGPLPSGDRAARNWEYINHDSWGTNYSPQKEINKDNAHLLELKWIFPIPQGSASVANQPGRGPTEGAAAPPLIVDGIVYFTDKMRNTKAFDAATGQLKWANNYKYNWTAALLRLPEIYGAGGDQHGNQFVNDIIFTSQNSCNAYAIDAKTGLKKFEIEDICSKVEGNVYNFPKDGSDPGYKGIGQYSGTSHPGAVYKKENIYVIGITGPDIAGRGGRSFMDGYDLNQNPPKRIWRTFLQPPGQGDPEWAIKACNEAKGGWYFSYPAFSKEGKLGINCKDVPRENVICDWGCPKHYTSVVTNIWGQMAMDEETGLVYFGTGDQGGFTNVTYTPGPNLFAASIIAMDAKTGKIVWWYQNVVRDQVEGDSSWNNVLANIGGRKMLIKFTTVGPIWALDAANGQPIWIFEAPFLKSRVDPDGVVRGRSAGIPSIGANPSNQDGYWVDIMNKYEVQEKKWLSYPKTQFYNLPIRPGESDIALDPETNTVYAAVGLGWDATYNIGPFKGFGTIGGALISNQPNQAKNTTIFAIDAATGKAKWSYYIRDVSFRGGIITTGGVVFVPSSDGNLYMLDAATGKLLHSRNFGTGLVVQPTIGKDANGKSLLLLLNGRSRAQIGGLAQVDVPGALMAFGLPDKLPQPQVITKEVIKEVPKEVIKEVVKEVPKEVTVETISPISYAAIGIGVVLVVISGVLFSRRKKV